MKRVPEDRLSLEGEQHRAREEGGGYVLYRGAANGSDLQTIPESTFNQIMAFRNSN